LSESPSKCSPGVRRQRVHRKASGEGPSLVLPDRRWCRCLRPGRDRLNSACHSMAAERGEVRRFTDPLCNVGTRFPEAMQVAVKFLRHHALVLPVVVAKDVAPVTNREYVNGSAVIKANTHLSQQLGGRISYSGNRHTSIPIPQWTIPRFNQQAALHISAFPRSSLGPSEAGGTADLNVLEPFEIGLVSDPFRNVSTGFMQKPEICVELMGHDALVFAIVIADDIVPFGNCPNID